MFLCALCGSILIHILCSLFNFLLLTLSKHKHNTNMTINNQNRAAWIKLLYYLSTFLYLASIVLLIYLNIPNLYLVLGSMTALFIGLIVFTLSLNFNFIIFQESEEKIILRYYPLHPFHDNFKSIEIPKKQLSHFDINKKVLGMRPEITLYQQTSKGVAKYPAVSISSLSKKDQQKMTEALKRNSLSK